MRELGKEIREFWNKKSFTVCLVMTMLLSYRTLLQNPTVGIDDTSFKLYYVDGVSPAMGRWCLFLINKIFPLDYNPYFVEAVGLLLFCLSVTLWCIVWRRLFGRSVSDWGYTLFACVMISSPIISEVVIWYLQDGIYLGYGMTALAVLAGMSAFGEKNRTNRRKRGKYLLFSALLLTVALGFYEAFMIVYLMGMVLVFLSVRLLDRKDYSVRPLEWLVNMSLMTGGTMVLRTVVVKLVIVVFHLESQTEVLKSRGLHEALAWFDGTKGLEEFVYVMKDFFVKYYINAIVYVPVTILVLGILVLAAVGIYYSVKKKDLWILLAVCGIVLLPWVLPVLEGVATYYRSSEYVPLLTAFAALLVVWACGRKGIKGILQYLGVFLALVLLYRQGYEMNKWLYVDALKYEDTKRTLSQVAFTIRENYNAAKPLCVIGQYDTPQGLEEDAYCPSWSKKYKLVEFFVNLVDKDLFEKYDTPYGYAFAQTPRLSFITWGNTAFYGYDRELVKFLHMHGFLFAEDSNQAHYEEARELMKDGPVWPEDGSIVELQDYIIVNFGEGIGNAQ